MLLLSTNVGAMIKKSLYQKGSGKVNVMCDNVGELSWKICFKTTIANHWVLKILAKI